jgi:hypothetical protein
MNLNLSSSLHILSYNFAAEHAMRHISVSARLYVFKIIFFIFHSFIVMYSCDGMKAAKISHDILSSSCISIENVNYVLHSHS